MIYENSKEARLELSETPVFLLVWTYGILMWYFLPPYLWNQIFSNFPQAKISKPHFRNLDRWRSGIGICISPQPTWEAGSREHSPYRIPAQWCCLCRTSLGLRKLKLILGLLA